MSDSIRILKINKILDNDLDGTTQDYSTESFWFEDNLEHSISMDFDKTIALKNKSVSKINLVQNANSHFFEPEKVNNLNFQKSDIENNSFESINIIDKVVKPADSRIRKEIIDMRRMSYENEQRDKEYLLSILNVDLKPHNNFKNYNLAKSEKIISDSDLIAEEISQLNAPINQQLEKNKKGAQLGLVLFDKVEKEVEKNIMVKFDDINHKQNNKDSLMPNKAKKRTLFDEMDTKELNLFFEVDKNSYSLPVINNSDYTVANTVDDLDKAINNLEFGSKKIREKEKFFDQEGGTTQLVEGLQQTLKANKKKSIEPINFDSSENWFNNSKDVKKLAKLAKKENKKMNKIIKK